MRDLMIAGLIACAAIAAQGAEIVVGAGGACRTIGEAVKAAKPGDTITVKGGTYREAVSLGVGGTATQPTTLKAAPGERVILTGFAPIEGWKDEGGGIFSATVEGQVSDLFVGWEPQPISRWPDPELPMRPLRNPSVEEGKFYDEELARARLQEIAASPGSLMAFIYAARGNYFTTLRIKGLDLAIGAAAVEKPATLKGLQGKGDKYQLINHRLLITQAGQWAFEGFGNNGTKIYFRPKSADDLKQTQYRKLGSRGLLHIGPPGGSKGSLANVRVEGLEVCGSAGKGIEVGGATGVTVARCIMHHNEANGLGVRRCGDIRIEGNVSMANGQGIGVVSSHDVVVEGNEMAYNTVDGLVVAGNVSGKPQGEPESFDVTVRGNYIHHHILFSHPDNMQTYRGVHRLTLENNVLLWGGQGLMSEQTEGGTIRDCVFAGTGAIAVIFGHSNSNDWTVERSTVGLGGWGSFSFTGKGYKLFDSIVWENMVSLPETLESDHNVIWRADAAQPVYIVSKPKWRRMMTPAEAASTGHEAHSQRVDPQFRNAPVFQAPALWDDANTRSYLKLRKNDYGTFAAGDQIEVNGDGVLRKVTEATGETIRFEPALPARPFREVLVWNWKNAASAALDLRVKEGSPALKAGRDGKPAGADLDIQAFVKGDWNGDGKRETPELPDDLKKSLPDPNAFVLPVMGQ